MIEYLSNHRREIEAARKRILKYVRRTPLLRTDLDDGLALKPECFQVTGSFKPRGAFNAILSLQEHGVDRLPELVAVSSGNHAMAVALAARTLGLPAVIVIPEDANPSKIAATRALGAEVVTEGVTFQNREERMRQIIDQRGSTLIHPFDNWDVIHGAGTAALEVLQDLPRPTAIVTPLGGGGLMSGTALVVKSADPSVQVIAVEPEIAADGAHTFASGKLQRLSESPPTVADGAANPSGGFEDLRSHGRAQADRRHRHRLRGSDHQGDDHSLDPIEVGA